MSADPKQHSVIPNQGYLFQQEIIPSTLCEASQNLILNVSGLVGQVLSLPLSILFFSMTLASEIFGFLPPKREYRSVVISGASSGIGEALAYQFAKDGVSLCLIGRNKERLETVASKCKAAGSQVTILQADLSKDEVKIKKSLLDYDKQFPVDLMINNAAVTGYSVSDDIEFIDKYHPIWDTNLQGNFHVVAPLFKKFCERKHGHIVFTSSINGWFGPPQQPFYNASKAALRSFAKDLRFVAAPFNVKVSVIYPGLIKTRMTAPMLSDDAKVPEFMAAAPDSIASSVARGLRNGSTEISYPFSELIPPFVANGLPPFVQHFGAWTMGVLKPVGSKLS